MTPLLCVTCALIVSEGFIVYALLKEFRDLRHENRILLDQIASTAATLAGTIEVLSKHFPLRNDKPLLEALHASVLDPRVPRSSH